MTTDGKTGRRIYLTVVVVRYKLAIRFAFDVNNKPEWVVAASRGTFAHAKKKTR